jgi:RNA polymerase sigma factor (sigma-70 family)
MATGQLGDFVQHLRTAVLLDDEAGPTDGQLLGRFVDHGDEDAFAALVRKHAPMVWGVCHRLLPQQDAEDAFQATFLVLLRKAASFTPRPMVANWLYGVAHRTALKARTMAAKRRHRERQVTEMPESATEESDLWSDLRPLIDREVSHLPDKQRVVIVLCELEGKTRKEAARQLGIPEGTVASRLNRGRTMLAKRLTRLGIPVSGIALATVLSRQSIATTVPPSLVRTAAHIARTLATGGTTASGLISAHAITLSEGVMKAMTLTKAGIGLIALVTIAAGGVGGGALFYHSQVAKAAHLDTGTSDFKPMADEQMYIFHRQSRSASKRKGETSRQTAGLAQQPRHTRQAELQLTGPDVIADDPAKAVIIGNEVIPLGGENGATLSGDRWRLSVGPATQIIIDGKRARLEDLKKVVEAVGPGHFIRVHGEWDFEVLKPRYSPQTGNAICIEVRGAQEDGLVEAVDVGKRIITIPRFKVTCTHRVAADAQVVIDGKAARLTDLKRNMHVSLLMSAVKGAPDLAVTAAGPNVEGLVEAVNAEANTIGVRIPSVQITAQCVPVAVDAKVVIDGKKSKLSDLKVGVRVTLQMCAEMDKSLVIGITTTRR